MSEYAATPLTTLRRRPARASYDRAAVAAILDEAIYCHVSYQVDGQPFCIPMIHARMEDALYIHGAAANRSLRALRDGASACVNVTLLDGLVLGRSAFHTSVNYRSVVVFGRGEEVTAAEEKLAAMRAIVESAVPQRWPDVRTPTPQELDMTLVVKIPLTEVSAKVRSGPPVDDEADYALPCWAGVIPLRQTPGAPIDDPRLSPGLSAPSYATGYARPAEQGAGK
jgi:nitroimidazol reductase NimA-like FMN-containing flavoprotein (pyridoxamine 5'-phosphate oxidase superfamily)